MNFSITPSFYAFYFNEGPNMQIKKKTDWDQVVERNIGTRLVLVRLLYF